MQIFSYSTQTLLGSLTAPSNVDPAVLSVHQMPIQYQQQQHTSLSHPPGTFSCWSALDMCDMSSISVMEITSSVWNHVSGLGGPIHLTTMIG